MGSKTRAGKEQKCKYFTLKIGRKVLFTIAAGSKNRKWPSGLCLENGFVKI
jgi:hypothetical protein